MTRARAEKGSSEYILKYAISMLLYAAALKTLVRSQRIIVATLRLLVGVLSDHFGDPVGHRETQQALSDTCLSFCRPRSKLWESPGEDFATFL